MSAGKTIAIVAHSGIVSSPLLRGTSQERFEVGLRPSGTCNFSVQTGTKQDIPTIKTIAIGTPKSPSARRACSMNIKNNDLLFLEA